MNKGSDGWSGRKGMVGRTAADFGRSARALSRGDGPIVRRGPNGIGGFVNQGETQGIE